MPLMMILVLTTLMIAYTSKLCEPSVTTPKHYGLIALYQKQKKCFKRKCLLKIQYIIHRESPKNAPPQQQNLFLVAESSLLGLFQFCPVCRSECERKVDSRLGTKITVTQKCFSCTFFTSWDSQPSVGDIPVGNIMLSSSILFGGGSPTKVLRILKHMNVPTICYSTFMNHQKKYLHTAVQRTYQQQQSTLLNNIKAEGRELIVGGDGRCDSPGHSAKYGTYSLMDAEQNKILHSQLVQVCTRVNYKWVLVSLFVLRKTAFLTLIFRATK